MSYTPGPWEWSDSYSSRAGDETMTLMGAEGDGVLSCDGVENAPLPKDARLIAAAPELVEALKIAHEALCRGWGEGSDFAIIRAALEKAGVEL
jgi:hypothetical protein